WAASRGSANPTPCPSAPPVRAEAGSSALHASLVRSSGLTVTRGSSGPVVVLIQTLVGATPDGAFGALTETMLRAFQKARGVPATGVVDYPTWRAVLRVTAPNGSAKVPFAVPFAVPLAAKVPARKAAAAVGKYARYERVVLRRGSTGPVVKVLQSALRTRADGKFGPGTQAKVRAYQKAHRLTRNGVVT